MKEIYFLTNIEDGMRDFWSVNFWGILGSITGILALSITYLGYRYNKPKIKVDYARLIYNDPVTIRNDLANKKISELQNKYIDYELDIVVRNERGGAGSIDKPTLLILVPTENRILHRYNTIKIRPGTEYEEHEKISENQERIKIVREGRAFNLKNGEKIDERLDYDVDEPNDIKLIADNFDKLKYMLEFKDNRGKRGRYKIKEFINEEEINE